MDKTKKIVYKNIKKLINKEKSKLMNDDALLRENLGMDSINLFLLLNNLSEAFNIRITKFADHELMSVRSVGDIIKLLKSRDQH